jgi:YD repeat-containing protein
MPGDIRFSGVLGGAARAVQPVGRGELAPKAYADGTSVQYTYDPLGNVETTTLEDGAVITRTYDAANRHTRSDFSTGGYQTFAYDAAGRLAQAVQTLDGHTTVTAYNYNHVGDVVSTTQRLDGGAAWQVGYANDYGSGTHTTTYPSGVTRTYSIDALSRLDTVKGNGGAVIADYAYDVVNRNNTLVYLNGLTNRVDYDALGRTTRASVVPTGVGRRWRTIAMATMAWATAPTCSAIT